MVVMTHNTDFGDAFERERDSPDYFRRFSTPGYAIGIDVDRLRADALKTASSRQPPASS